MPSCVCLEKPCFALLKTPTTNARCVRELCSPTMVHPMMNDEGNALVDVNAYGLLRSRRSKVAEPLHPHKSKNCAGSDSTGLVFLTAPSDQMPRTWLVAGAAQSPLRTSCSPVSHSIS